MSLTFVFIDILPIEDFFFCLFELSTELVGVTCQLFSPSKLSVLLHIIYL